MKIDETKKQIRKKLKSKPLNFQQLGNTNCNNNYNINKNVTKNRSAAKKATGKKMTDELKNNNNGIVGNISSNNITNNNISNNNNNSDRIIAEATKLLLKNGLNGSTAAAASLLSAAAAAAAAAAEAGGTSLHLPPPPPPPPTHHTGVFATSNAAAGATTIQSCTINNGKPPASLSSTTTKTAATAATSTISATTPFSKQQRAATMAAATASTTNTELLSTAVAATTSSSSPPLSTPSSIDSSGGNEYKVDNGVIDYTVNATAMATSAAATNLMKNQNKFANSSIGSCSSDIGRHPISAAPCFGGRLQFFKDGKFILELARSKDGEKGGWVSVPRKVFRTPSSATSSTITPTATTSTAYPKNESSTSLSFSDDNSSIQSSPWQRDHCWKQTAPRSGISKEMSLFYQRSNHLTLSTIGLQTSRKKRRRPFDNTLTPTWEKAFSPLDNKMALAISSTLNTICVNSKYNVTADADSKISKIDCSSDDDICSNSSSTATLTGGDCIDGGSVVTSKTPTPTTATESLTSSPKSNVELKTHIKSEDAEIEIKIETTLVETMNTSEDDDHNDVDEEMIMATVKQESTKEQVNGDAFKEKTTNVTQSSMEEKIVATKSKTKIDDNFGTGEKRLKKLKTRAKLITIIQKLIDRLPTTGHHLHFSKIPQAGISGSGSSGAHLLLNHSNLLAQKISPPSSSSSTSSSNSAATRLVELQYHQQHVSPRKRILREFEKVSLEDTAAAAGGKRSRAKASTTTSAINVAKSSPQRVQSTVCAAPTTATTTTTTTTNGSFSKSGSVGPTKSVQPLPPPPPASSTPTRLYSSYSIHSLLGGGNPTSSSSSLSTTSTVTGTSKKINEQAIISNSSNYHHQQHQQHYTDPSYLRAMLASPKSPETSCSIGGIGGKSPSNLSSKKRSPPYSSPLHDNHSRSPTVATHIAATGDYGRRSPRQTTISLPSSSSPFQTSQQQHHQHQQQQVFYSPYMMSPKYVPAPQTSMSPSSTSTSNVASRSPRHSSAFSAHIPHTNAAASANSIPSRELSSPTRSATASPREPNASNSNTPRTVPKKTASIRRQFASPTSCPSPSERVDDQERKTPLTAINHSSGGTAPLHNYHQRASPNTIMAGNTASASVSPLHYYNMYPPNSTANSPSTISGASSSSGSTAAQAAAAAAAAYIPTVIPPSYYHPYISTLAALRNPMWMHHYPGATSIMTPHPASPQATAAPPSSRFSQPFHNFPYNGINAAAVAAAAAAAAFSGPIPPSHLTQMGLIGHQMMAAPSAIHHAGGGVFGSGGGPTHSPKLTDDNINTLATTSKQTTTTAITMFPNNMKEEHSSDVPLNLSKH